ncbi:MAG: PqqD family protein [Acidobacteriota bacterium]|jgi:hypothetical protein|nr:PqqD family protein [Acidobacteriota bacterium]NLT32446.1 PqqD family protein [Acidobacteriota bacterium]
MYEVNEPRIIHEVIEGNAVVIDGERGLYYALNPVGTFLFSALAAGASPDDVVEALAEGGGSRGWDAREAVPRFLGELLRQEILRPAREASRTHDLKPPAGGEAPTLTCFEDLQELLLIDPIHQVDISEGWPVERND